MKILWISPWFGNYRVPVYNYLNKYSNNNFYLICSKENTTELVQRKLKETLHDHVIILEGEKRITIGNGSSNFANKTLVIKRQPGLYKSIKKINPDIIITEGFGGWAPTGIKYAIFHRKKLCMFYERTAYVERNSPKWRTLYRHFIGMPVKHFLINGHLTEEYLNRGLGFKKTPKTKGCMAADSYGLSEAVNKMTKDDKDKLKQQLKLKDGLTYLFVGQMVERKGIKELLQAWQKHHKNHANDNLIVIGTGVLLDSLRNEYKNSDSIFILGEINYNNLYQYYAICDVFIMPTLEDNWCLVIPEAMACSKPVACSIYNGGYYELVKDGINGYSFDPLNENSILNVLTKFHTADLQSMASKSKEIESNFTPDKAAKRIYNACLKVHKDEN